MQQIYAVANTQPSTVRTINYGNVPTSQSFFQNKESSRELEVHNTTIASDTIRTDFGKIKGVEVLYFRTAQLERTVAGQSAFASMGPLQVLYFPQYDRFVLSLNSWKYPLLKRIPVVGSSASMGIPVTYTLPTVNGFFSLIIPKIEHMESLANLESIMSHGASFTVSDSDEVSTHGNILGGQSTGAHLHQSQYGNAPNNLPMHGNMMQSNYSPRQDANYNHSHLGQSFNNTFQSGVNQPVTGKKQSIWKRIFRKSEYGRDRGDRVGSSKHNLNMIQKRDIESMKMTNEVMAAVHYYPRKEVERWIIYNKEMANLMGFSPELADQDLTPFGHSVLNRSSIENSDPSLPCNQPITADRPIESITYQVGQNFTSATRHDGKQKHGYIEAHSHSIHPEISGRYNNLSTSNFEADRFKNMTNSSALYEATGISPISKVDQPFTFNHINDNILPPENKPSITEKIKEAVTGNHTAGHTETIRQPEQGHVSFADKVQNLVHHNEKPLTTTGTASTYTTGTTTNISNAQPSRVLESRLLSHNIVNEPLQSTTQQLSGSTVTSTLPTLQERIRTVGTTLEQPTVGQRIKNAFSGTEHANDLVQHHYAA